MQRQSSFNIWWHWWHHCDHKKRDELKPVLSEHAKTILKAIPTKALRGKDRCSIKGSFSKVQFESKGRYLPKSASLINSRSEFASNWCTLINELISRPQTAQLFNNAIPKLPQHYIVLINWHKIEDLGSKLAKLLHAQMYIPQTPIEPTHYQNQLQLLVSPSMENCSGQWSLENCSLWNRLSGNSSLG